MQHLTFRAMGSQVDILLDTQDECDHLAQVPAWFAAWEQQVSRFRADSELVQLNHHTGQWLPVSPVLYDIVQLAIWAAYESDGLVTPTLLDALEASGYDRSFETLSSHHWGYTSQPRISHHAIADWRAIELNPHTRSVRVPANVRLDLGGFAKGWAAQQAMHKLASFAPVLVNAGGDIAVSGLRTDGSRWPVGVADPADPNQHLELLMIDRGGIATSGRDFRCWQHHGIWQHHILDPRTGRPALTDLLSVTVIAPTACEAEMAARVALILGSHAALSWLEARPSLAGLLVTEAGSVMHSHRLPFYFWEGYRT